MRKISIAEFRRRMSVGTTVFRSIQLSMPDFIDAVAALPEDDERLAKVFRRYNREVLKNTPYELQISLGATVPGGEKNVNPSYMTYGKGGGAWITDDENAVAIKSDDDEGTSIILYQFHNY